LALGFVKCFVGPLGQCWAIPAINPLLADADGQRGWSSRFCRVVLTEKLAAGENQQGVMKFAEIALSFLASWPK